MRNFLINLIVFSLAFVFVFICFFVLTKHVITHNFYYKIPKEKNILLLGDSHVECAINDSIFNKSYNLAQSGTSYFYSYLKLRELLRFNTQIDTLVLGYSYHNLFKDWYSPDKYIEKIRNYYPLMSYSDISSIFMSNPSAVLYNIPIGIFDNLQILIKGEKYNLGGHLKLNRNEINESGKLEIPTNDSLVISKYESKYLLEIYKLCRENNITLILLNTPIHPKAEKKLGKYKYSYFQFKVKNIQNAILVNHSNFHIPKTCWGDIYHLNYKGSEIYTEFLKKNGFKEIN